MSALDDFISGGKTAVPPAATPAATPAAVVPAEPAAAAATHAPAPSSLSAFLSAPIQKKAPAKHDPSALQNVEAWSQTALESPVGKTLNSVLNATSNFGVGTADALAKGHGWNSFAEGVNAISHPGQASNTVHDLESRMHLYQAGKNAPWWGRVFQTAEDFTIQTGLDPAMWIPGLDVASIVGKSLKIGKAITGTEREVLGATTHTAAETPNLYRYQAKAGEPSAHPNRGGEFYQDDPVWGKQGYENQGVSPNANPGRKAEAVVNSEGGSNRIARVQDAKNPLVVKESTEEGWPGILKSRGLGHLAGKVNSADDLYAALKTSGVPLKDVANMKRYGDTSMALDRLLADHARSLGHDAVQLPGGEFFALDKGAVREAKPASSTTAPSTFTGLTPIGKAAKAVANSAPGKAVSNVAAEFNKYFNADHELDKLMTPAGKDVLKAREAGQEYERKNLTDDALGEVNRKLLDKESNPATIAARFVQDHADKLKPGVTESDLASHLAVKKSQVLLDREMSKQEPGLLQKFSRYGRDTLFLLPFAHMKNLSIVALLGPGGAKTLAAGAGYMGKIAKSDAGTLDKIENLKKLGVAVDYGSGVDKGAQEAAETSMYSHIPGLGKLSATSTKALTDYDTAMRLALYDHLKAKGLDDVTIGGHIRSTMGDYGNQSRFISDMRRVGANFPAWRAGIVPRAMLKAIKEQPKNVKMYAQASGDIENDKPFPGQNGAGFNAGSVPEDFSELASPPAGTLAYGTSASTVGPIATVEQMKGQAARGDLSDFAKQQVENVVPFGSILSKIPALNTFSGNTQASPWLQAAGGLVGARFPDTKSYKQKKAQLEALGLRGAELYKKLREGGYMADNSPLGK